MNILIVYAHPEPQSLNHALKVQMIDHLRAAGHSVQVSDLYEMDWKAVLDRHDMMSKDPSEPFDPSLDSKHAYESGTQSIDIAKEQEKSLWADHVIFQFPLWWFSMPAIMKGWFERVYAYGFAYGYGEHSDTHWGDRYGEGRFSGKRAMLVVTAGGWEPHYSARGVNGPIDDILFPIHHGMLFYPGFQVLPPYVMYRVGKMDEARFQQTCTELFARLDSLETTDPIPYFTQNGGAYDIPSLTLKSDINPQLSGFSAHMDER
ncbi:NAD(P)H-dependent oxidoreductase [Vibrio gazogenes]|uniref:NAD(P)H dehydrogenase (Quinone) n=1 Tax=Vibrio gazogenes DSM 21264 = NBRC 103151 TaxID=1123492 RepID=A0A1M4YGU5_VIBGA|nr:NAD(P)H-dependent oxidoreductase [Vibrio gazogenes]USP14976.1 NAD(P)H-dependent oxidoreductase [Vibrio gazogenes]SHF04898.1 NAD(P)H dehydrogenase (quinone) [Vibrio gazogenes DSM 21264] [Vibrio gazogenes DSM 21264 = NBRC 103151]SJN55834.1 General stress protein 14 [Vibrio gazogenes]